MHPGALIDKVGFQMQQSPWISTISLLQYLDKRSLIIRPAVDKCLLVPRKIIKELVPDFPFFQRIRSKELSLLPFIAEDSNKAMEVNVVSVCFDIVKVNGDVINESDIPSNHRLAGLTGQRMLGQRKYSTSFLGRCDPISLVVSKQPHPSMMRARLV